jgi:ABC-type phosphate/phosphonate transport system substrate-binding protein
MKIIGRGVVFAVLSGLFTISLSASAADTITKVSLRAPAEPAANFRLAENNELVLGAAPREDANQANSLYGPVAEYLSTVLGRKVVFHHAGNWGVYQGLMQKGAYDLVFDGPHFASWRAENSGHTALLKVPGEHVFVVLVKKDNDKIKDLKQLAGRAICAHAPPNLATLTVLNEFPNAARQPLIVNTDGWKNIYQAMLDNKCVASSIPLSKLEQFEKDGGRQARIIFRGATLPDNALTAGPRLSPSDQEKIARALMSPEGEKATAKLRDKYAQGKQFVATSNKDFVGLSAYLKNEWGF